MKIEQNVGRLDSFLRLSLGLSLLGLGISKKSHLMIFYGAEKTAEGIIRFCPMYNLLGITTVNDKIEFLDGKNKKEIELDAVQSQ